MYTINITTFGSVNHPTKTIDLWVHAFMDVVDLAEMYTAKSFMCPNDPTFQAEIRDTDRIVATYDNISGWHFNQ